MMIVYNHKKKVIFHHVRFVACQCKRGSNRLRFGKPKVASPGCSESAQEAKIKAGRGDGEAGCEVGGVFYIAVWVTVSSMRHLYPNFQI